MIKQICDRCGKEIKDTFWVDLILHWDYIEHDLCGSCRKDLRKWVLAGKK